MIVSSLELFYARQRFATLLQDRYSIFDADAPASVHLRLRIPAAATYSHLSLTAVLDAPLPATASSATNPASPSPTPPATPALPEVSRISISPSDASSFCTFDHAFPVTRDVPDARLLLFATDPSDPAAREYLIATCSVSVSSLVSTPTERLEVDLAPAPPDPALHLDYFDLARSRVEFALEWMSHAGVQLVLEVRIKVRKDSGWPFATARPFFVMYRWEPADTSWTPLYRSEVLTKASDRNDANGSMIFQMAEIFLGDRHVDVDDRPLRLELFHYKTTDSPKLVAYINTSLCALRHAIVGDPLKLELNTFIPGELIGSLSLNASRVTLKRHFFSLQADLGGEISGPPIYLDINVLEEKRPPIWSRVRPCYMVSRYNDLGKWEHIYRSEQPTRVFGKRNYSKYKIAKFSEDKLLKGNVHRIISLMFVYDNGKNEEKPTGIGHLITTPSLLLEATAGTSFELAPPIEGGESPGYIIMLQAGKTPTLTYLEATCVLGKPPPPDAIRPLLSSESPSARWPPAPM